MKFSCPKCAAKYQIADEKVAGRTVKMKCRKCGTTIPIRAEPSPQEIARAPVVRADSLRPVPRAGGPPSAPSRRAPSAPAVAPAPDLAPAPTAVEWHAGIDGQAVGPMSVREIERRVGDGSIHAETYLWREGMDGWKPMPQVPELAPILTRSLRPLAVPPPSMPAPAKAQRRDLPARPMVVGGLAIADAPPSSGSPVASHPIIHEVAPPPPGWAALDGLDPPGERGPKSKIAVPAPAAVAAAPPENPLLSAQEAPVPVIDMPPHDSPRPGSLRPSYESLVMQLRKQRKNPYAIPFAVLAAVVFGVTIGFVLFGEQETKIVKQIIEVPVKVSEAIDMKKSAKSMENTLAAEDAAGDDPGAAASPTPSSKPGTSATKSPGIQEPKEVKGLSGLSGLDGLGGPSGGPSGPSVSGGGGEPLSSSQIQTTVSNNLASVKRGCWEKALMTRDRDAPSSARVTVAITVAPSGSVTSATSNGDPKGYSGLSSCIVQRVRGWSFPRSSGQTTVNVPFVFAAQ